MNAQGFLHRYFLNNGQKIISKWLHYFDIYEHHFERFRNRRPVVIEIGIRGGGSLSMWKEYFGPSCHIIGLDINPDYKIFDADGIEVFVGSQDDPRVISSILDKYGPPDIVIDDGSHIVDHVIKTFQILYPHLSSNGIYLVEDTYTSYWPRFGGGLKKPGTFIERCKELIDELNAFHSKGAVPISGFTKNTQSITFYDSVVVFEKRPQGIRKPLTTKAMDQTCKAAGSPSKRFCAEP